MIAHQSEGTLFIYLFILGGWGGGGKLFLFFLPMNIRTHISFLGCRIKNVQKKKSMSLSQCSHVTQHGFTRLWERPQHKLKYILLAFVFSNSRIQKLLLIFINTTYSLNSQIFLNTTLCRKKIINFFLKKIDFSIN